MIYIIAGKEHETPGLWVTNKTWKDRVHEGQHTVTDSSRPVSPAIAGGAGGVGGGAYNLPSVGSASAWGSGSFVDASGAMQEYVNFTAGRVAISFRIVCTRV
jgi:hypothetical protein